MNFKYFIFCIVWLFVISCGPEPIVNGSSEIITTVKLTSKKLNKTFTYKKINNQVSMDTIFIASKTSDTFSVVVLNENSNTSKDLTPEISLEKNDHQVFYNASSDLNIAFRYLDKDDNNYPIGLNVELTTGPSCKGNLGVVLKHQPSVKNGSQNIGSSDIDASFILIIK